MNDIITFEKFEDYKEYLKTHPDSVMGIFYSENNQDWELLKETTKEIDLLSINDYVEEDIYEFDDFVKKFSKLSFDYDDFEYFIDSKTTIDNLKKESRYFKNPVVVFESFNDDMHTYVEERYNVEFYGEFKTLVLGIVN